MKFKFKIQQYQSNAVDNTVAVFAGQPSHRITEYRRDPGQTKDGEYEQDMLAFSGYRNHHIELDPSTLLKNIKYLSSVISSYLTICLYTFSSSLAHVLCFGF